VDQATDFMSRVLAWPGPQGPGWCNLHWQMPARTGMGGRSFTSAVEFMEAVKLIKHDPRYKELYFCLSTQKEEHRRNAASATYLKSIWLDIDVKPGRTYDTLEAAVDALLAFCTAAKLPLPTASIRSGGGLHVYWISNRPLTVAEWRPYAEGLKAEAKKHLLCDLGVIADAARVLRIPDTVNRKLADNPRPVTIITLRPDDHDFSKPEFRRLADLVTTPSAPVSAPVTELPDFAKNGPMSQAFNSMPASNPLSDIYDKNILLSPERVEQECLHFKDCKTSHGAKHSEPLWAQTILATTFFENGEALAHEYSDGYPAYTYEETQEKYNTKLRQRLEKDLGWPSCGAFENAGVNCKACPLYGKITSPLKLAQRVSEAVTFMNQAEGLELPPGYNTNSEGIIQQIVTKKTKDGVPTDNYLPLFMCKLRNPIAQRGARRAISFECSLDGDTWGPVEVEDAILYTDIALLKQLRACGVKTFVPNESRIRAFMTSWMAKLDRARKRIETIPFGWLREDDSGKELGFAYGGLLFKTDGTTQRSGYANEKLGRFYKPCGDRAVWIRVFKIITDQKRPALEAIIAMSLAAPLISLLGKHNCVGNAWSVESGAHKTTAQCIGLAIWGNPRLTKENPMSSVKGVIHKLGMLKNLPMYWDEILSVEKMDQIRAVVNYVCEGSGATNLTQNRDFHSKDEWQTLMMLSSNMSLMGNIMQNTKSTSAQLERVFEFYVDRMPNTIMDSDMSIMVNSLEFNYGQIGLEYAKYLGGNAEKIREHVKQVLDIFAISVAQRNEERFRAAMVACIYSGAEIANTNLGLTFNLELLWDFLRNEFLRQRTSIKSANVEGGSTTNTAAAVTEFFKAHTRNTLWVEKLPWTTVGKPAPILWIAGPNREHPDAVHIRISVRDRTIEVSRARLLRYFLDTDYDAFMVIKGLTRHFGAKEEHRINLATGSGVMGGRETIIKIPVPAGSPFIEDVFRHTAIDDRPDDAKEITPDLPDPVTGQVPATAPPPKAMAPLAILESTETTAEGVVSEEVLPASMKEMIEQARKETDLLDKLIRQG
jgi:hypothetical protein